MSDIRWEIIHDVKHPDVALALVGADREGLVCVVPMLNSADRDRDGKVSWGEWSASFFTGTKTVQKSHVAHAKQAYGMKSGDISAYVQGRNELNNILLEVMKNPFPTMDLSGLVKESARSFGNAAVEIATISAESFYVRPKRTLDIKKILTERKAALDGALKN